MAIVAVVSGRPEGMAKRSPCRLAGLAGCSYRYFRLKRQQDLQNLRFTKVVLAVSQHFPSRGVLSLPAAARPTTSASPHSIKHFFPPLLSFSGHQKHPAQPRMDLPLCLFGAKSSRRLYASFLRKVWAGRMDTSSWIIGSPLLDGSLCCGDELGVSEKGVHLFP